MKEPSTEHVMLYSDVEQTVRNNSKHLTIRGVMTFLRGRLTAPGVGDYAIATGDVAHNEIGHAYFLSFREIGKPDSTTPLIITHKDVNYNGDKAAVVDDEMLQIARFMLNNAIWEYDTTDDGRDLP